MSAIELPDFNRADSPAAPSGAMGDARRAMEICNACRYCEGFCPVFPAMERRRVFAGGDLTHLANLCHNCKGCWHACQYAPPHEFGVNVPQSLSHLRSESYERHAWPPALGRMFERNGLRMTMLTALVFALTMLVSMLAIRDETFYGVHRGPGAFYEVVPHDVMAGIGGLTFGFAVIALFMGARSYWREAGGGPVRLRDVASALKAAGTTRHLGGGTDEAGCNDVDERYRVGRRHLHNATMWGFLLCFASTSSATVMHYVFGLEAPYAWHTPPVVLGAVGGIGLTLGTFGLFAVKVKADRRPADEKRFGMDYAFLALLNIVSTTGLALLFFRHTSAMGGLLAIHLAFVYAFFLAMPYGKFVHGVYRLLALVRDAAEARTEAAGPPRTDPDARS